MKITKREVKLIRDEHQEIIDQNLRAPISNQNPSMRVIHERLVAICDLALKIFAEKKK